MEEDIKVIEKNGTLEFSKLLEGHKAIEVNWTFKFKKKIVKKKVELVHVKIQDQVADIFTKYPTLKT